MTTDNRFRAFFGAAATILVLSLIIWLIPSVFLGSVTGRIDHLELKDSLTEAEQQYLTELYWTKIWWETQQATLFNPVAIVLFAISVLIMLYGIIVKFGW
jgi:hypothetical protein